MQKQYALNKQLTFIVVVCCLFVCSSVDCVTVIKSTSNQKVLQPKSNDMQRRIQNPARHLRWTVICTKVLGYI